MHKQKKLNHIKILVLMLEHPGPRILLTEVLHIHIVTLYNVADIFINNSHHHTNLHACSSALL